MAFQLGFTTSSSANGDELLIQDTSTDWASMSKTVTKVIFTITSLFSDVELTTDPVVVEFDNVADPKFLEGFEYSITLTNLFGANPGITTISDSIYRIAMTLEDAGGLITDIGYNYTSEELFYYNADYFRASELVRLLADNVINKTEMLYIGYVDALFEGLLADSNVGNDSNVFRKLKIFNRLRDEL